MHTFLGPRFCGGFANWRLVVLHHVAQALGLLVHVEGFPYGSRRNIDFGRNESGICQSAAKPII